MFAVDSMEGTYEYAVVVVQKCHSIEEAKDRERRSTVSLVSSNSSSAGSTLNALVDDNERCILTGFSEGDVTDSEFLYLS